MKRRFFFFSILLSFAVSSPSAWLITAQLWSHLCPAPLHSSVLLSPLFCYLYFQSSKINLFVFPVHYLIHIPSFYVVRCMPLLAVWRHSLLDKPSVMSRHAGFVVVDTDTLLLACYRTSTWSSMLLVLMKEIMSCSFSKLQGMRVHGPWSMILIFKVELSYWSASVIDSWSLFGTQNIVW